MQAELRTYSGGITQRILEGGIMKKLTEEFQAKKLVEEFPAAVVCACGVIFLAAAVFFLVAPSAILDVRPDINPALIKGGGAALVVISCCILIQAIIKLASVRSK
jgi:hypothetical protein